MDIPQFADDVRRQLRADGYDVHRGRPCDGPELAGAFWFTWMVPGMASAEVGETVDGEWQAWALSLAHRLAESAIALDAGAAQDATPGIFSAPPEGLARRSAAR